MDFAPKLRIIEAMLEDVAGGGGADATMILSRRQTPVAREAAKDEVALESIAKLPSLVLQGRILEALAACHSAERRMATHAGHNAMKTRVEELRGCLEQEVLVQEIELAGMHTRYQLLPRQSVLIGRASPAGIADIAVNCRWFSRGEQTLQLSSEKSASEKSEWFIADLGSGNGSFVGEKRLGATERFSLPPGETTVEIGRTADGLAPVVVKFERMAREIVIVSVGPGAGLYRAGVQSWPNLQHDIEKRWVVFHDRFFLQDGDEREAVAAAAQPHALAQVFFKNGLWIEPQQGKSLLLDDIRFDGAVPLPAGRHLKIGGLHFQLRHLRRDGIEPGAGDMRAAQS